MPQRCDDELVRAVAEGDEQALEELMLRHQPWLAADLMRRLGRAEVVNELVQESFLVVWDRASDYRARGSFKGWLWVIATNRYRSFVRTWSFKHLVGWPGADWEPPDPRSLEQDLIEIERAELGQRAWQRLDETEREALSLSKAFSGLSGQQAAQQLGISHDSFRARLSRAKKAWSAMVQSLETER